jgi:pilus assembly protein CpaF
MDLTVRIQSSREGVEVHRFSAQGPFVIGRHESCRVRLRGDLVSRNHVIVTAHDRGLKVRDVSSNGTRAGTLLLRKNEAEVEHGTPIEVGDYRLVIKPDDGDIPRQARDVHAGRGAEGSFESGRQTPLPPPEDDDREPRDEEAAKNQAADGALRREIHRRLLDYLDLAKLDTKKLDDPSTRPRVLAALRSIIQGMNDQIPPRLDRDSLLGELADEALGLGPLERFLADPDVTEIMVVDASTIYVETHGRICKMDARFTDDERVRAAIERIVTPLGRRIDESSPLVDARLKDGSRVNAIIRPLAIRGSCITIRKFASTPLTMSDLVSFGTLEPRVARFLQRCVRARKNVVISGGTGSGKTTLLNVLSAAIPSRERIVTIEDAAELRLEQPHVVSLEARPANMEGKGQYTIRDLVANALRMRPDRIVVGECRGGEALDMLQAMNTGHDGSLTTTHANSPIDAMARLETLCLMSAIDLPARAIREQLAKAIDIVVQQTRFPDGSRRVTEVCEVVGLDDDGEVALRRLFEYRQHGMDESGRVLGDFVATGYLPTFLNEFIVKGLVARGEPYL